MQHRVFFPEVDHAGRVRNVSHLMRVDSDGVGLRETVERFAHERREAGIGRIECFQVSAPGCIYMEPEYPVMHGFLFLPESHHITERIDRSLLRRTQGTNQRQHDLTTWHLVDGRAESIHIHPEVSVNRQKDHVSLAQSQQVGNFADAIVGSLRCQDHRFEVETFIDSI